MQHREELAIFLLGRARAGVLRTLLANPAARLSARELASETALSEGTVRHEARMLEALGLLVLHAEQRNRARYQANAAHAAFTHLQQLLALERMPEPLPRRKGGGT